MGSFQNILTDDIVGEQATQLYEDAQVILKQIIKKQSLKAKAVFGLFEANTINDDDISIQKKGKEIAVFQNLASTIKKTRRYCKQCFGRFYCTKRPLN